MWREGFTTHAFTGFILIVGLRGRSLQLHLPTSDHGGRFLIESMDSGYWKGIFSAEKVPFQHPHCLFEIEFGPRTEILRHGLHGPRCIKRNKTISTSFLRSISKRKYVRWKGAFKAEKAKKSPFQHTVHIYIKSRPQETRINRLIPLNIMCNVCTETTVLVKL